MNAALPIQLDGSCVPNFNLPPGTLSRCRHYRALALPSRVKKYRRCVCVSWSCFCLLCHAGLQGALDYRCSAIGVVFDIHALFPFSYDWIVLYCICFAQHPYIHGNMAFHTSIPVHTQPVGTQPCHAGLVPPRPRGARDRESLPV